MVPFPFKYCGEILLQGQVVRKVKGVIGDKALLDLNYFRQIDDSELDDIIKCDGCGREFLALRYISGHREKRLCTDDSGEVLEPSVLMDRAVRGRTDKTIMDALPDTKRRELDGR